MRNYGYNRRMDHFDSSVIDALGGNSKVAELCNISSQAVSKWRFLPATRDGEAIESWREMTVRFQLPE